MPPAESNRRPPVRIFATVTYCDPKWGMLFVSGDQTGAYLEIPSDTPVFSPGEIIRIEGILRGTNGYVEILPRRLLSTGRQGALVPRSPGVS